MASKSAQKVVRLGALDRPQGVTLAPINGDLIDAVAVDGWFQDEKSNRLEGFGLGDAGRLLAYETFLGVATQRVPAVGIYRRGVPAGFLAWLPRDVVGEEHPYGRRVAVHVHLAPGARGYGVGASALAQWLKTAFQDGIYRVESEVLHINRGAVRGLEHLGFHREARLTSALWMDDNPYDLILLRLLRKDWEG